MNQTLHRLEMIKTAISIGDFDVVHLLQLKIALISNDERIQEIARELHHKNYVVAQQLIEAYLQDPPKEHTPSSFEDEEDLKEVFELFEEPKEEIESFPSPETFDEEIATLLEHTPQNEPVETTSLAPSASPVESTPSDIPPLLDDNLALKKTQRQPETDDEPIETVTPRRANAASDFAPIPHIEKKYRHLLEQYPPVIAKETLCEEAKRVMEYIANDGGNDETIEKTIERMRSLKNKGRLDDAAQLLLLAAATPSTFAQYMLARELFRGEILQPNPKEAFTMIEHLAKNEDCAEAICDLAQLYELGIGRKKDTKKAEELYKEAMQRGIRRAEKHYMRLHKANRGLFAFFRT